MRKLAFVSCVLSLLLLPTAPAPAAPSSFRQQAARAIWHYFPRATRAKALRVSACETANFTDQYNDGSGAKGIFQVIPGNDGRALFDWRTGRLALRIIYAKLYDMYYSARVAFYLSRGGTDWHEWSCGYA